MSPANRKIRVCVIGASGYTGSDLVRLALKHPFIELVQLTANAHAGKTMAEVFPHFSGFNLPSLVRNEDVSWQDIDAVFCGLPHATSQEIIATLPQKIRIIDMSADFRLEDPLLYEKWYGTPHKALNLQKEAVYGLTEFYRTDIARARLVACPGCYPTAVLLALLPILRENLIESSDILIDAKSGVSGSGRSLKQNTLFCEAGEGISPYAIANHRHTPEIEQEITKFSGKSTVISFTPHLVPMSRGELVTLYLKLLPGKTAKECETALRTFYEQDAFVVLAPPGVYPSTQWVRGSNRVMLGIYPDRNPNRVILVAAIDNLVKGSAGQALQNFNVMFGFPEETGLEQVALFP